MPIYEIFFTGNDEFDQVRQDAIKEAANAQKTQKVFGGGTKEIKEGKSDRRQRRGGDRNDRGGDHRGGRNSEENDGHVTRTVGEENSNGGTKNNDKTKGQSKDDITTNNNGSSRGGGRGGGKKIMKNVNSLISRKKSNPNSIFEFFFSHKK